MHRNLKVIDGGNSSENTEKWAQKLRTQAKNLVKRIDEGYLEMGQLLWQIYDTPSVGGGALYRHWGYSTFADYVEKELGIHPKRAQRLRSVWYNLEVRLKDHITAEARERLVRLGFSKVREMVNVLTPENFEGWVEKGEELSYPALSAALKEYRSAVEKLSIAREQAASGNELLQEGDSEVELDRSGGSWGGSGGGDPAPVDALIHETSMPEIPTVTSETYHRRHFLLYPDQAEIVDAALERAAEISDSDSKSNNLHLICLDFLAHNDFGKATREQKLRLLAQMERILGFKLVVFDGEDVVYGLKTLESVVNE